MSHELPASDPTDEAILGGRLRLLQPRTGHRVGHDAILLAAATTAHAGEHAIDLGAGVGAVGLALAVRHRRGEQGVRLGELARREAVVASDHDAECDHAAGDEQGQPAALGELLHDRDAEDAGGHDERGEGVDQAAEARLRRVVPPRPVNAQAEQAQREGVPLSDLEKRMMCFTESDDAVENPIALNEEFEAQYDTAEYEGKIAGLLGRAYNRLKAEGSGAVKTWDESIKELKKGDHYILVMWAERRIAAAGLRGQVSVDLMDYRQVRGQYDAILSVEMIEAVAERYWPDYFRALDRLLAPGGRVGLQAITMPHERMLATRRTQTWILKYVFPGGLIPSVTAKTKSACASGRMRLTVPSPGPRPNQPPRRKDSTAVSTWNVSPDAGSRKRLMRAATWGTVA